MSDTKGSNRSRDPAPSRAETSAPAGASSSKPAQWQASAASLYWHGVAAAGRAARVAAVPFAETATTGRQQGVRA